MLQTDAATLQNFTEAVQYEWLETNGLGGWSSSSVTGCHTRRYHGLLIAAIHPPTERMALLSKLDETIVCGKERFELGTNQYTRAVHPTGYQYATAFTKELFPCFFYTARHVQLKKTVAMVQGENTVLLIYDVIKAEQPFTLELLPLVSVRNYHSLMHANDLINQQASFTNDVFCTKAYQDTPDIFIKIPGGSFQPDPKWYYAFNYAVETYRGLDDTEDMFTHGLFNVTLKQGDTLGIIISTEDPVNKNAAELFLLEEKRKKALLKDQPPGETTRQLLLAADQFIVKRGDNLKTVIAGYHWFTDWSRDTMISLPGLTLGTGRYEDAKKILSAFAGSISQGMLPNRFTDNGGTPEYNNVDGTLWYFIAIYKYLKATNDHDFVLQQILPGLKEVIRWHLKGTRYNIHADEDGLLYAGAAGQQLTWMDAKVGDWVVTPRMGKPVEVQALWYNALKIFAELLQLNKETAAAEAMQANAEKTRNSFIAKFWYATGHYLYDLLDEHGKPDKTIRPNQLFAISLPFALVEGEKAKLILELVEKQLYTPVGLKTLPKANKSYIPVYGGDTLHRDAAYHQGTVWSWLLGPYIDAIMSEPEFTALDGLKGKSKAVHVIENFRYHLNEACIGSVSEIFDADIPHHSRGCIAQAWGVAEILRVIKEYGLEC